MGSYHRGTKYVKISKTKLEMMLGCEMRGNHNSGSIETVTPVRLKSLISMVRLGEHFTRDDIANLLSQNSRNKGVKDIYVDQHIKWGLDLNLFEKHEGRFSRLS